MWSYFLTVLITSQHDFELTVRGKSSMGNYRAEKVTKQTTIMFLKWIRIKSITLGCTWVYESILNNSVCIIINSSINGDAENATIRFSPLISASLVMTLYMYIQRTVGFHINLTYCRSSTFGIEEMNKVFFKVIIFFANFLTIEDWDHKPLFTWDKVYLFFRIPCQFYKLPYELWH